MFFVVVPFRPRNDPPPVKTLGSVPVFSSLSPEDLRRLTALSRELKPEKGADVFSDGEKADAFFVVLEGCFKIYKISPRGEERTLHIQQPGDLLAEAAVFDAGTYPASCQALDRNGRLLRIPREAFVRLLQSQPEIGLKLLAGYSRRLRGFVAMIEDLTLRNIRERLARYLIEEGKGRKSFRLRISKKELASYLGTIPETLSRALAHFRAEGILKEERATLVIEKPEALASLLQEP
jgi:CRP/FNR family transcriptional regulator, dissimilatory nitrate respiration regulator